MKTIKQLTGIYDFFVFDCDGTLTPLRDGSDGIFHFEFLPRVEKVMKFIRKKGVEIAVTSNQSGKREREEILMQMWFVAEHLCIPKKLVLWETDKRLKKPHPHMLLKACKIADRQTYNAIFIGDAESDFEAAQNSGMDFMWAIDFFSLDIK